MLTVITGPPDTGYRLETGTARAGGNVLTTTFGAGLWLIYWHPAISYILSFIFSIYHL